jgi:hypothetical protein
VLFKSGEYEQRIDYAHMVGKGGNSARLQRPPFSLKPDQRAIRKDAVSDETRAHVREIYESCATSPHQRDVLKRRINRVTESEPALIMSATFAEMYAAFQKLFPTDKLSYAEFKLLKPWNLKKAYRETCLCRTCGELFGMYREALQKVGTALEPILAPSDHGLEDGQGDGDGDDSGTPGGVGAEGSGGDGGSTSSRDPLISTARDIPALQALADFCRLKRKGELA